MTLTEATLRFIAEHRRDDVRVLALQAGKYPDVDMPTALTQIAGRQTAETKYRRGPLQKAYSIHPTYPWNNARRR